MYSLERSREAKLSGTVNVLQLDMKRSQSCKSSRESEKGCHVDSRRYWHHPQQMTLTHSDAG